MSAGFEVSDREERGERALLYNRRRFWRAKSRYMRQGRVLVGPLPYMFHLGLSYIACHSHAMSFVSSRAVFNGFSWSFHEF